MSMAIEISDRDRLVENPSVSVLMLAYNHGPYIADAIASVIAQASAYPFELLIGEDLSSDETREIALDYQAQHPDKIRLFASRSNLGMHANHRQLIDAARGEFLAWCEADDYWIATDKVERQVEYLRDHPGVGLVHSDFTHIRRIGGQWRAKERSWALHRPDMPQGSVFEDLLVANFVQTCTMMARTDLVRDFQRSDLAHNDYKVADWPMCLAISAHHEIAYLDTSTAVYRHVEGSVTNSGYSADIVRTRDSIRMATDFVLHYCKRPDLEQSAHITAHLHVLRLALRSGSQEVAREALSWIDIHCHAELSRRKRGVIWVVTRSRFAAAVFSRLLAERERIALRRLYREPVPPMKPHP